MQLLESVYYKQVKWTLLDSMLFPGFQLKRWRDIGVIPQIHVVNAYYVGYYLEKLPSKDCMGWKTG